VSTTAEQVAEGGAGAAEVHGTRSTAVPTYEGDFVLTGHFLLECGRTLKDAVLHYAVYGRLNEARDNVMLVCHALSGSALVANWWPQLFAGDAEEKRILRSSQDDSADHDANSEAGRQASLHAGGIVDLKRDCVLCVNLLGSCYGSTGPGSVDQETGRVFGPEFPLISIGDNVRAQARLLDSLGIRKLALVIGGSIGGMQALDWAILFPDRVERAAVIAVAPLSAMGLALNHLQRQAIQNDPDWLGGNYLSYKQPRRGLALARQIATLSYKSPQLLAERFGRNPNRNGEDPWALDGQGGGLGVVEGFGGDGRSGGRFDVAGYLDYQGERFLERFDANAYLAILRTMDTWEPTRGFASAREAYGRIRAELIFLAISSDWLFPPGDVRALADAVRAAVEENGTRVEYREMRTDHGHDAFLAEQSELIRLLHREGRERD